MHGVDELLQADAPVVVLVENVKDALHEERLRRKKWNIVTKIARFHILSTFNYNTTRRLTYVFRVDDVLEVLQSDLSVVADGAAEHVFQPFQILRRELTPGTAIGRKERMIGTNREDLAQPHIITAVEVL